VGVVGVGLEQDFEISHMRCGGREGGWGGGETWDQTALVRELGVLSLLEHETGR
jgi:hypothetical protein